MIGNIISFIIAVIVIGYVCNFIGYWQGLRHYYYLLKHKTPESRKVIKEINELFDKREKQ